MRLWTLHPRHLDPQGLVALWREALLAQAVLRGKTKGYKNHPQLRRFKKCADPVGAIGRYLKVVLQESRRRGYRFDGTKIASFNRRIKIKTTRGQVKYERNHLSKKLKQRNLKFLKLLNASSKIKTHPLFRIRPGTVEDWEQV